MADLIELVGHPQLSEPVVVMALDGWIDAGSAGAGAATALLGSIDTEVVAKFDTDALLDHRARRPVMSLVEGHIARLTWPTIELRAGIDESGRHVLFLVGAEPDHAWHRFSTEVVALLGELDVRLVIGLGAYPAPVPHTRDARLALTSPSRTLMDSFTGFFRGTVDVPAGIQAAIEVRSHEAGIDAMGLWAQVPHYISGMPYPPGSLALVDGLSRVAGLTFSDSGLAVEAASTRARLDEMVNGNDQHEAMIRQLEQLLDATPLDSMSDIDLAGPLPTGDELAAEFQQFLREQGD